MADIVRIWLIIYTKYVNLKSAKHLETMKLRSAV